MNRIAWDLADWKYLRSGRETSKLYHVSGRGASKGSRTSINWSSVGKAQGCHSVVAIVDRI